MMVQTMNRLHYWAFGMHITSEIALPELVATQFVESQTDIEVVIGELTDRWEQAVKYQGYYGMFDDCVLMYIPGAAIFEVDRGHRITVHPFHNDSFDLIRLYILGTCMGLLLMRRGLIPLHGSAIVVHGRAYAFVGESGAGKSTLAAALIHRGYRLLSDDVIPLKNTDGGSIIVPAYPQQKLWQASLDGLGMDGSYQPLYDRQTKFAVPVVDCFHDEEIRLAGVFELAKTADERVTVSEITGLARIHTLMIHTYRGSLVPLLKREQWHFSSCAKLAESPSMYRIRRPEHAFTVNDIVDQVLETITRSEKANDER